MPRNWLKENKILMIFIVGSSLSLAIAWILYAFFGHQLINEMYSGNSVSLFNISEGLSGQYAVDEFYGMAEQVLIILSSLLMVFIIFVSFKTSLINLFAKLFRNQTEDGIRRKVFSLLILLGCSWAFYYIFLKYGYEGNWYVIKDVMTFSESPPFQHRILFVLLAQLTKTALPFISYKTSYFISQIVSIVLTFYIIKKWAGLFIAKELTFIAQILLAAILIPTVTYYTFYDVGVVFFYTVCLYFLYKQQFLKYLFWFAIGTLNHEITLFLILIYAAINFDGCIKKSRVWGNILLQVITYFAVRGILFYFIPVTNFWQPNKVWRNIEMILNDPFDLFIRDFGVVCWFLIALLGIKYAPQILKRSLILLLPLIGMVLLVGQIHESRIFNSLIPIKIALILCFISSFFQGKEPQNKTCVPLNSCDRISST